MGRFDAHGFPSLGWASTHDVLLNGRVCDFQNNCGGTMGSPLAHSGYACEQAVLVASWRKMWSVEPGTTPPLAPFGIATIANSGSEGHSNKMAALRYAQQSNYGRWDNPALPNTFGAQVYDLPEPWANVGDGDQPKKHCCYEYAKGVCPKGKGAPNVCGDIYNCSLPSVETGKYGTECVDWASPAFAAKWHPAVENMKAVVRLNSPSGHPGARFMGAIHPRLKRPVGRRLAVALLALTGVTKGAAQGPTLASCAVYGTAMSLAFNASMLGNEKLSVRPYESNMSNWYYGVDSGGNRQYKTDSMGLMVCTAKGSFNPNPSKHPVPMNASTCACMEWDELTFTDPGSGHENTAGYCAVGPGWKPSAEQLAASHALRVASGYYEKKANGTLGRSDSNSGFAVQWTAVPLVQGPGSTLTADLYKLNGQTPLAVRLAWPLVRFSTRSLVIPPPTRIQLLRRGA